jgi:hypothetical protein
MALPVLDAVFASSADLPRTQLLSKWLTEQLGSGSIADFSTLPERYLYAKIAVSLGGPRTEQEYIELPKSYAWSDIYGAIIFNRTAPAAPSSLTLTPLTSSSIKLDWVTNGASVAYSVERSVDGAAFQVIGTTAIGATTATNTGLSIASNYQYRIRGSSGGFFTGYSNTASASTYDANASSFIATSGATDIVAINDFVLGVKILGLWNSMVCWPLRSSQNAGTGTTAYSLGGLGAANATLSNGPTWGSNGAPFTTAQSAFAPLSALNQDVTLLFCGAGDGSTYGTFPHFFGVQSEAGFTDNQIVLSPEFGVASSVSTLYRNSFSAAVAGNVTSGMSASTSFVFLTGSAKLNELLNVKNVGANTTNSRASLASGTATLDRMQLNGRYTPSGLRVAMTCAFCAIVTPNISGSETAIYTLYKDTLGQGLTGL